MNVADTVKKQLVMLVNKYPDLLVEGQIAENTLSYDVDSGKNTTQSALYTFRGVYKSEADKRIQQDVVPESVDQIYIWGTFSEPTTTDELKIDGVLYPIKEVHPVRVGKIVVMYLIKIKK